MEYREFTIKEASEYLETDIANVYKLIKENILTPIANEPMKLTEFQLLAYLNTRIPTHLKVYPRELEVAYYEYKKRMGTIISFITKEKER